MEVRLTRAARATSVKVGTPSGTGAPVAEQQVLPRLRPVVLRRSQAGEEDVDPAVAVVVADRHAVPEVGASQARRGGVVAEGAVAVVQVEAVGGGAAADEVQVLPAVVVEVRGGATGGHRQQGLEGGPVARREPGRLGLLREAQLLRGGVGARHQQRAETGHQELQGAAMHGSAA